MDWKTPRSQRDVARTLRSNMTGAERRLWSVLRKRQVGVKFRRQVPIGPYVVDFLCHEARLIVEMDGWSHGSAVQQSRDVARDVYLRRVGFRVLRIWNCQVMEDIEGVWVIIREASQQFPHPDLPPQAGEGAPAARPVLRSSGRDA